MPSAQSAFVSYSRDDSEFALRLTQDLKAAGAHVWLDQLDIQPGHPWDNAIEEALNTAPQMLLILSPASAKSENVRNEISYALEQGKIIIPVLYQDCTVPLRLQRTQRIDFRADYARGLHSLMTHLHVIQPDSSVLEKAAEEEDKRRAAWQAREAEATRLRETPERQQEEAERKAREEEEQRLKEVREQAERDRLERERAEKERLQQEADAAALREKQRKADLEAAERRKKVIRWASIGGPVAAVLIGFGIYLAQPKPPPPNPGPTAPVSPQTVEPSAAAVALYQEASNAADRKDWTGAAALLDKSCSQGYAAGCMTLGYRYEQGLGTGTADQVRAVALFQKACDEGNASGCDHLAIHYVTGAGLSTGPNLTLARQTYQKSCELGDSSSCAQLKDPKFQPPTTSIVNSTPSADAEALNKQANGYFDDKDYKHAAPLYQQACDLGQSFACTSLGYLYSQGDGVLKNPVTAVAYYQKACTAGDSLGCADLGNHIRDGDGAAKSPQLATTYFEKACNGGYGIGCRNLAILYDTGSTLGTDLAKAKQYYQKGCALKDQESCNAAKDARFN